MSRTRTNENDERLNVNPQQAHDCIANEKGKTDESQVLHVKRIAWTFKFSACQRTVVL